jgi:uncharacterized membrane protein
MNLSSGERRCSVGVGSQGEPIFEQFVLLSWHKEIVSTMQRRAEAAESDKKAAEDKALECMTTLRETQAQLRAVKEAVRPMLFGIRGVAECGEDQFYAALVSSWNV